MHPVCKFLISVIIIKSVLLLGINSECNVCSKASMVACTNRTAFRLCNATNHLMSQEFNCPDPLVCKDVLQVCVDESASPVPLGCAINPNAYAKCGERFACLNEVTYALCFNGVIQPNINGTCPEDQICDIKATGFGNFCSNRVAPKNCDLIVKTPTDKPTNMDSKLTNSLVAKVIIIINGNYD